MDTWVTSLLVATFSSLMVGVIMAVFKTKLDEHVAAIKDANNFKFTSVTDKLLALEKKQAQSDMTLGELLKDSNRTNVKLEVLKLEQQHVSENLSRVRESVEKTNEIVMRDYGKVVLK